MEKRKKKRRIRKRAVFLCAIFLVVILCIIIQVFFTPDWTDGNTHNVAKSDEGVHTQERTEFNEDDINTSIIITNE